MIWTVPSRESSAEVPIPYGKHLEEAALPKVDDIGAAQGMIPHHG